MLHIVNKSPFEKNSTDTCLRLALPGSDILLIENGIYAGMGGLQSKMEDAIESYSVFVLEPDMQARGIDKKQMIEGVQYVDYEGFVGLVTKNETSQSWL